VSHALNTISENQKITHYAVRLHRTFRNRTSNSHRQHLYASLALAGSYERNNSADNLAVTDALRV